MNKTKALKVFSQLFEKKEQHINDWIKNECQKFEAIPYNSIDVRNSGFKIAPVDVNFFSAGFNNLHESSLDIASKEFLNFIKNTDSKIKKILIIGEDHDRNLKYLENLFFLQRILINSGFDVLVSNFANTEKKVIKIDENKLIEIHGIKYDENNLRLLTTNNFDPDIILINNDMTIRYPDFLDKVKQKIVPNLLCGWFNRKKSTYFDIYQQLMNEFCQEFSIDPWVFSCESKEINNISFKNKNDLEKIASCVEEILQKTKNKYEEYEIKWANPYCFVKSNNGTYGMGVISVESSEEILSLNKNSRNDMRSGKQGSEINSLIIQEGIPTIEKVGPATAEKTLYLVNGELIGGFYRCNQGKNSKISLNSRSSFYEKIAFEEANQPILKFIAKMSYIAAGRESEFYKSQEKTKEISFTI
jgi:glutamate--cysteine ligase